MPEHTLLFSSGISQDIANQLAGHVASIVQQQAITRLTIAINSGGGNVVAGIFLHNFLRSLPCEVVTHNIGNVDSIANAVYMAGAVRKATPSATFMFHGVGFDGNANERLEERNLKEKLDTILADHTRIAQIVASASSLRETACMGLFETQSTKSADWARENRIVHEIAPFQFPAPGVSTFASLFG